MSRKALNEQITSGFPATADMERTFADGREVPQAVVVSDAVGYADIRG
jgi:hypothetical protein